VFGNDTEGRDSSVKLAGFQEADWPISLLIRHYEVRYSGSFRLNQAKKDFEPEKTSPLMTRITLICTDMKRIEETGPRAKQHNFAQRKLSDMSYWIVDGQKLTNEQYEELERQKLLEQQKIQDESERLSRQLGEAYAALKHHLERNPNASHKITDERALEQQIYYNLRQNLQRADAAPRCVWIREDGTVCKSPRMKNDIHCYAHYQMRHASAENLLLPALTDANAIQMAVMVVQRALIDGEITEKKAGLLLYSIQIAAANVGKTTFGQADAEMVREIRDEEEVMDAHQQQMEKLKRIEKAKSLPLVTTENTDLKTGEKTSPRINTDQTDLSGGIGKILPQSVESSLEGYAS
jgi:hypothetical protein